MATIHACQNCDWVGDAHDLKPIKDIFERVAPGEIMPAGECPECGALAHQVEAKTKIAPNFRVKVSEHAYGTLAIIDYRENVRDHAALDEAYAEAVNEALDYKRNDILGF